MLTHPTFIFGGGSSGDTQHRLIGVGLGITAAFFAAAAFMTIKALGRTEEPIVMTFYFHAIAGVAASVPLCFSFPQAPVIPDLQQVGLLCGVVLTSFFGQLLISRGFQLLSASLAAALNLTQVRLAPCAADAVPDFVALATVVLHSMHRCYICSS